MAATLYSLPLLRPVNVNSAMLPLSTGCRGLRSTPLTTLLTHGGTVLDSLMRPSSAASTFDGIRDCPEISVQGANWRQRNSMASAALNADCSLLAAPPWPPSMFS
ncbi:Uncharacterised protein [Mycobacteroides abscessus subsp. abscessus]|nr:Uncharacterised protein [Mycobacteroides abscessus subsp. abscessus]